MKRNFIHTSESVTEGHPDKLCDQISDAIVDRFLERDYGSRVIAECAVSLSVVFIAIVGFMVLQRLAKTPQGPIPEAAALRMIVCVKDALAVAFCDSVVIPHHQTIHVFLLESA